MNNKYFAINIHTGSILGPCNNLEQAEHQLILVEYPKEWIVVKSVNDFQEKSKVGFHFHDDSCYSMGPGDTEIRTCNSIIHSETTQEQENNPASIPTKSIERIRQNLKRFERE